MTDTTKNFTTFDKKTGAWSDDGDYLVGYLADGSAETSVTKGGLAATLAHAAHALQTPLTRWRKALSRVQGGLGNARILCMGDSTTYGTGSTGAGSGQNNLKAYPTQLASQLGARTSCSSFSESWFGTGTSSGDGSRLTNDSRIVSTAEVFSSLNSLGGCMAQFDSTQTLVFTPRAQCDTFRVWYTTFSGGGTLGLQCGSGAVTQVDTNSANSASSSMTVTGTPGDALTLSHAAGSSAYVFGIEAWDSTASSLQVANAGYYGAVTSTITGATDDASDYWSPLRTVPLIAPDLIVLSSGINDWDTGVTVANYTSYLTTFVNTVKATSDVLLVSPPPSDTSDQSIPSLATQQEFVDAMRSVAVATGVLFHDNWQRSGSRAGFPELYFDVLHPNAAGYADIARGLSGLLSAV